MPRREEVIRVIFRAVDELNREMPEERRLEKSADAALFGRQSVLDSLGLVSLIVAVEQKIEDEFGISITLADERALSRSESPFLTIGTLADYICELSGEDQSG